MIADEPALREFLERAGLIPPGSTAPFEPLAGGVSSDIWLVDSGATRVCVKRALPRLRVSADWRVDPSRSENEVRWLRHVARLDPRRVPAVVASDPSLHVFAMEYLPPDRYEPWKLQLARGHVEAVTAKAVGEHLGAIHAGFAAMPSAAEEFDTGGAFHALRIEPYLLATARAHPDVAWALESLAERTAQTKMTVVHGDVSPKNLLIGPGGPRFLDAECAWFGDPAFDLAFCLNHLLLKTMWVPAAERGLLRAFDLLTRAYLAGVTWEPPADVERRTARLLPGLLLARIDGKSPVEYLTDEASKDTVRRAAKRMLQHPRETLGEVRGAWADRSQKAASPRPASGAARIERVIGRRVWDSRGRPTVEAEVVLTNGASGRAIAPAGASTGLHEAVDLRDGGAPFGGLGVDRAVGHVSKELAEALAGMDVGDQESIDRRLIELDGTPNKSRLGANAIVAVSMAALHAAAAARGLPLWRHLADRVDPILPMPMVQIFGGGAHAGWRVDVQDFLIVPIGASTFAQAMSMAVRVYEAAGRLMAERGALRGVADEGGWWPAFSSNRQALDTLVLAIQRAGLRPGVEAAIALDIAASQLRRGTSYRFAAEDREMDSGELAEVLLGWCRRYPIVSIEDPLAQDDDEGMAAFTARAGEGLQVVGDDYLVTSAVRIADAAARGACNAVLLKPNQAGTITETRAALRAARAAGWRTIVSARSGESEDVTIVHLAVGWAAGQLKVGSCARGERTAKWNEALRIEEALGASAALARL